MSDSSVPASAQPLDFFSRQVLANRRYYVEVGRRSPSALAVVAVGFETCAPTYVMERAAFPFFAIELVVRGEGQVDLAGTPHRLATGSIFSYGPSLPHRIASSQSPLHKYFITFRGHTARRLLQQAGLTAGTCREVARPAHLIAVWEELLQLASRTRSGAQDEPLVGLRFLLAVLGQTNLADAARGRARATLERCEVYLQQHFLQVHRLQQVADACHVDLPYLCRLSRRFLGQTLYHYLQRLKMSWAADRLHSDCLVREVADELGLDPFQFSRTFKRVHGIAPSEFQRLYRS